MKKFFLTSAAIFAVFTIITLNASSQNSGKGWLKDAPMDYWQDVGTAGFSAGTSSYISMVFSTIGDLYIAYSDSLNGFKACVKKYDGANDGLLVFDSGGTARVGDIGSEQPLTTRIETPTNNYIAYWDSGNTRIDFKQLTTSDVSGSEVTLTFNSGLTRSSNEIRNDLITGIAGGQTIYGGISSGDTLTIFGNTGTTVSSVNF
ncbi:MAG: hypothetical protein WCL00_08850, partial [Bacteroidota bacterium]